MPRYGNALDLSQVAPPATPVAGRSVLYPKGDGRFYSKGPEGIEREVTTNLYVQAGPAPVMPTPGLWIELNANGTVKTMWVGTN